MEAWILHIQEQYFTSHDEYEHHNDQYSAWATETQALKQAAQYLIEKAEWCSVFRNRTPLYKAVKILISTGHIREAIDLTNTYTEPVKEESSSPTFPPKGCRIYITKSIFSGSPFE